MSISSRLELAGRVCRRVIQEISSLLGGTPSSETFSDPGSDGTSSLFARSDHVHGMPDAPLDSIDDTSLLITDEYLASGPGTQRSDTSPSATQAHSDIGSKGGFGTIDYTTNPVINTLDASVGVVYGGGSISTLSTDTVLPSRLENLFARLAPVLEPGLLHSLTLVIGGFKARSIAAGATSARDLSEITDGLFIRLVLDAFGGGTYEGVFVENGQETTVDLGIGATSDYQRFKVELVPEDGQARFFVGDMSVPLGSLPAVPTVKISAWGVVLENDSPISRTLSMDFFGLRLRRIA